MAEVPGSILCGITFYCWIFLVPCCQASDANIAIIAIFGYFVKTSSNCVKSRQNTNRRSMRGGNVFTFLSVCLSVHRVREIRKSGLVQVIHGLGGWDHKLLTHIPRPWTVLTLPWTMDHLTSPDLWPIEP